MKKRKIFGRIAAVLSAAAVIAVILSAVYVYRVYHVKMTWDDTVDEIKASKCSRLMIVAHPDDETIWGGLHLAEGGWYVVCVTNGNNDTRSSEFKKILEATGNEGVIMSYPDKVFNKRDSWKNVYSSIEKSLEEIIIAKDWEEIACHNPAGEYGHMHHKMVSRMVSSVCCEKKLTDRLWYFGKYYRKNELENIKKGDIKYTEQEIEDKERMLEIYISQKSTADKLSHMNPYEDWIKYCDWE